MPGLTIKIIIALLTVIVTFQFFGNYFPPFSEYIIAAAIIFWALNERAAYWNYLRGNPEPRKYQLSLPEAYSAIKFVLRTTTFGRARWTIQYDDKRTGQIDACITVVKKLDLDGRKECFDQSVSLTVQMTPEEDATEVALTFWVDSEGAGRSAANEVIDITTEAIDSELDFLEEAHLQMQDESLEEEQAS